MTQKPVIGVTMGDPAGVGPEIAIKALSNPQVFRLCIPVLIGDLGILKETAERLGVNASFQTIHFPKSTEGEGSQIKVIDMKNVDLRTFKVGKASAEAGKASIEYIEKAVEYAMRCEVDAVATGPINKHAAQLAGSQQIGHTEMLASLCGVEDPLTMFWVRGVRIFFLTRHLSLAEAIRAVKKNIIVDTAAKVAYELWRMGLKKPIIAIAALNPHASDEGLIGDNEQKEIIPAVKELRSRGIRVVGPVPADTVFLKAFEGRYDAVLSLYHDQGHIAAKTIDFYGTVSVTLGLPFLRTSVDHGTAYDIAGKGVADSRSLEEAIIIAAKLVKKLT